MKRFADSPSAITIRRSSSARACSRHRLDAAAGGARRLALQGPAHLADFADIGGGDTANDGAAVGQQVDDADAGQGDQGLADRRMTDAEALGQFLRDKMRAGVSRPWKTSPISDCTIACRRRP